jgi:hypothetical protein
MSSYFQQKLPNIDIFLGNYPNLFGILGGSLPEFIHPFGFSLLGMGLISKIRKSRVLICSIFLIINVSFEIGQKFSAYIIEYIPGWFNKFFILENTKNYFVMGRFSVSDLIAIFLGSILAFIVGELMVIKGGIMNEKTA